MEISEYELRKRLEREFRRLERDKAQWDKIVPEKIHTAYFGMGLETRGIAIYNLLLGNKEEAMNWFEKAAEYYSKSRIKGKDGEVQISIWIVLSSILSKNKDLMEKSAKIINDLSYNTPSYFYYFTSCLSNLILDNEEYALKDAERLKELEPTNYSRLKYYKGLGKMCRGIGKKDNELIKQGLEDILKRHESLVPSLGETMDDALVCIPATALILLAKEKGLKIKPDDIKEKYRKYIPWILLD